MTAFVKVLFLITAVDFCYWGFYVCKREVPTREWSDVVWNLLMHAILAVWAGFLIFGGA